MYKLLTFCEDYGDEFNVPALAVMTEEEYQKWLVTPSGELNKDYETELGVYNRYKLARQNFVKELMKKDLYVKAKANFTEEEITWYKINEVPYYNYDVPRKCVSNMYAWLGNYGEYFAEKYQHLYLMEEFVDAGLVKVFDVDENFYNIFTAAKLDKLSLCNVFTIDEY